MQSNMKKTRSKNLRSFLFLLLAAAACLVFFHYNDRATLYNVPGDVVVIGDHPANNRQYRATVWMGVYADKLYFCSRKGMFSNRTEYGRKLYVFEDGEAHEVARLSQNVSEFHMMGQSGAHLYYWVKKWEKSKQYSLYCYDLSTNSKQVIYQGEPNGKKTSYFAEDGTCYFPLDVKHPEDVPQFVHVSGTEVLEVCPLTKGYPLGGKTYEVVAGYGDAEAERILCKESDGTTTELTFEKGSCTRAIIPCVGGLLVHNYNLPTMLYYIRNDGEMTLLFSLPCLTSHSSVQTCGSSVYLSVKRYESYGEIGMRRFENDTEEGTWRIDLKDGTKEKINDYIFCGMYNFDDTCIYCCDEDGNIYRMELDGEVSPILVRNN